jgi:hypothetical protein
MLRIKFRNTVDRCTVRTRIEINDFGIGVLEREDNRVGGKCREVRMEFLWQSK